MLLLNHSQHGPGLVKMVLGKNTCQKFAEQSFDSCGAFIFPMRRTNMSRITWKDEMSI